MVKVQVSTDELVAGRYRLLEVVHHEEGRDGWHGQDVESERPVTVTRSRLPAHLREEAELRTAVRITRESEALGLVCPGRVSVVVDVVEDNDFLWTVTARPEGVPLSALLGHGPVDYVRAAQIGLGVLDILGAAHQEGITHGDLSPCQVWVSERGGVTVAGFGLMGASASPRVTAPSYASPSRPVARAVDRPRTCGRWARSCTRWSRADRPSGTGEGSKRRSAPCNGCLSEPR
ncbi:hypothetical protein HEP84_57375 [Streptomyces sp. RLB1-33]